MGWGMDGVSWCRQVHLEVTRLQSTGLFLSLLSASTTEAPGVIQDLSRESASKKRNKGNRGVI